MDEMRQVSRTVATAVALFLLISPHALGYEDDSSGEGLQIDRNIEDSMHQMASNLENGAGMSLHDTNRISKAFAHLADYIKYKANKYIPSHGGNSFGIYFEFSNKKRRRHN